MFCDLQERQSLFVACPALLVQYGGHISILTKTLKYFLAHSSQPVTLSIKDWWVWYRASFESLLRSVRREIKIESLRSLTWSVHRGSRSQLKPCCRFLDEAKRWRFFGGSWVVFVPLVKGSCRWDSIPPWTWPPRTSCMSWSARRTWKYPDACWLLLTSCYSERSSMWGERQQPGTARSLFRPLRQTQRSEAAPRNPSHSRPTVTCRDGFFDTSQLRCRLQDKTIPARRPKDKTKTRQRQRQDKDKTIPARLPKAIYRRGRPRVLPALLRRGEAPSQPLAGNRPLIYNKVPAIFSDEISFSFDETCWESLTSAGFLRRRLQSTEKDKLMIYLIIIIIMIIKIIMIITLMMIPGTTRRAPRCQSTPCCGTVASPLVAPVALFSFFQVA